MHYQQHIHRAILSSIINNYYMTYVRHEKNGSKPHMRWVQSVND